MICIVNKKKALFISLTTARIQVTWKEVLRTDFRELCIRLSINIATISTA